MPTVSQWPDVVHKPNLFVAKRFGCVGDALAWEILPRGADVPNSDGATSRGPACGSSACRSSTGGKPIRGLQCLVFSSRLAQRVHWIASLADLLRCGACHRVDQGWNEERHEEVAQQGL